MRGNKLSRRYAVALADVAEQTGSIEQVAGELSALAGAIGSERAFRSAMETPRMGREGKRDLCRELCRELNLSDHISRLLDYLVEKKRTSILPELAHSFALEADDRLGVCEATLTSAAELTDEQRAEVISKLGALSGAEIRLREGVDETLIAGFQVELGGEFFDGSLRGRLEKLKEMITDGD